MKLEKNILLKRSFRSKYTYFFSLINLWIGLIYALPAKSQETSSVEAARAITVIIHPLSLTSVENPLDSMRVGVSSLGAHGVVIHRDDSSYTLITAAHVLKRLQCEEVGCTVTPAYRNVEDFSVQEFKAPDLEPIGNNSSLDFSLGRFVDEINIYGSPDVSLNAPEEGTIVLVFGLLRRSGEFMGIRSRVIGESSYKKLYAGCPSDLISSSSIRGNTSPLVYEIIGGNISKYPDGFSGGPVLNLSNQLIAIQSFASDPSPLTGKEKCSYAGSGPEIQDIIISDVMNRLPPNVRNDIVASVGIETVDVNEDENTPYVFILRRQRLSDPNHGNDGGHAN